MANIKDQISHFFHGLLKSRRTMRKAAFGCLVLAVLYSLFSTVSFVYTRTHTISGWLDTLTPSWLIFVALAGQIVGLFLVSYVAVYLWKTTSGDDSPAQSEQKGPIGSLKRIAVYAAIIFGIWLIWIIPHYPGTLRDDTLAQMFQWYQVVDYYTQHPVTDTIIFGAFFSLGDLLGARESGIFIFILIQAALTALGFAWALEYIRKNGVQDWLVWAFLLFYAFARVIYQPVDTMSKDALSATFVVPAFILILEAIKTRGTSLRDAKQVIVLCTLVFFSIVTKRTMLYVFLIVFVALTIWLAVKKARWPIGAASFLVPALCALLVWNPIVNSIVGATENRTYEMYSIPVQQVTRTLIAHPDALSEAEYERLGKFLDYERAVQAYNPWRSDEVNATEVEDPDTAALIEIWVKLGIRHPDSYLAAFFDLTGNWYTVLNRISYGHDSHAELESEERMEAWTAGFFEGDRESAYAFFDEFDLCHPSWTQPLVSLEEKVDKLQIAIPFVASYGFYCFFMPILVIAYCAAKRNVRGLIALSLPLALMISFVVGPIALYWYTMPMVYIFPMVASVPILFGEPKVDDSQGKPESVSVERSTDGS